MIMYIMGMNVIILQNFSGNLIDTIQFLLTIALFVWVIVDFILIVNNKFYDIKPLKKPKKYKSVALEF